MFETLDSARQQKVVSPGLTRLFFGTYCLAGALGASLDLYRHGLHRPVLLGVEILMFAVSVAWLRDSWMGLQGEKYSSRFLFLMVLLVLLNFIRDLWYS
jgi:hypothetical protein